MRRSYPRLPKVFGEVEFLRLTDTHARAGIAGVRDLVRFDHERKRPVATGRIATADEIEHVRAAVIEEIDEWVGKGSVGSAEAEFDNALGAALHRALEIVPSDAAHDDTWSFLTLVVFPDVAVLRFPGLHRDRLFGTTRNVLRRTWQRQDVLGSLMQAPDGALGEDELVGLFERSAMVRNKALAREAAKAVLAYNEPKRSQWARRLYKTIAYQTGAILLDVLDENSLRHFVAEAAASATASFAKDVERDAH
jgi:hypothetical protein